MSIIRDVLREEARAEIERYATPSVGYVLDYNSISNRMDVVAVDPRTGENVTLLGVLYAVPMYGFHGVEPRQGHRVILIFEGGDITRPRAISMFDDEYSRYGGPYEALATEFSAASANIHNVPQGNMDAGYITIPEGDTTR